MTEDSEELLFIPDDKTSQFQAQRFELREGDILLYLKLFTMNNKAIINRNYDVGDAMSDVQGKWIFDDPEKIRKALHRAVDDCINHAKQYMKIEE